jgi:hypothetical protein
MDPVKLATTAIPPVAVTIIGGDPATTTGTIATTAGQTQPNLVITVVTPVVALAVRFLNVYLGMVVGLLGTAMTSSAITAPDFGHLILKCAGLAIGGAVVLSLKDLVTIFGKLEQKYPLATGSI